MDLSRPTSTGCVDHLDDLAYRTVPAHRCWPSIAVGVGFADLVRAGHHRRPPARAPYGADPRRHRTSCTRSPAWRCSPRSSSVTGISLLTVEIPLVMYTLVIFVRNIAAGFDSVPPDVLEAADGLGYTAASGCGASRCRWPCR